MDSEQPPLLLNWSGETPALRFNWDNVAPKPVGFINGFALGIFAGGKSTWDFITSLATLKGLESLAKEIAFQINLLNPYGGYSEKFQVSFQAYSLYHEVPYWDSYDWGFAAGFGIEKLIESAGISKGVGLASNFKWLRNSGGVINGLSISKGSGYGSKPRFDFHRLSNSMNSRLTSRLTIPKWMDGWLLPHWHYGKGQNLRYHRPWEIGPDGKRRW